jgi:flagellar assembly protein FliH
LSDSARRWVGPEFAASRAPVTARALEDTAAAAREEGFAQGRREGLEQGRAQMQAQVARVASILDQLAHPLAAFDIEVEKQMVALCLQIGAQLALRELKIDPGTIAQLVRESIKLLSPQSRDIRVRLHPDDVAAVAPLLEADGNRGWQLQGDAKLARGDCMVNTDAAEVDARLDSRVAELARGLFESQP